jgi:hypothetical protein
MAEALAARNHHPSWRAVIACHVSGSMYRLPGLLRASW